LSGRRGRLPSKTKVQHSDDPPSPPLPLLTLINKAYVESKTTASPTPNVGSFFVENSSMIFQIWYLFCLSKKRT
uniref:Ovule protein n=1 Tax=Gongylonema pulchrum TaxID=637853 RepID=A0A183DMH5_9BILA